MNWINDEIDALARVVNLVRESPELLATLERICAMAVACLERGGKILTLGNGGSATDALHLAEELTGRFRVNRRPLPALCLAADPTALTCIGNDFGFAQIFARPLEALCAPGDVVVAFSTSGHSENILLALEMARAKGGLTVGLLGKGGGEARALCDEAFVVPDNTSARVQELHTFALHAICEAIERRFAN